MANGFITLENGEVFFTRWTGYDLIMEIAAKESEILGDYELTAWLKTLFPNENEEKTNTVFWNSKGELVTRCTDLRGLTKNNRQKFWTALSNGSEKLLRQGKEYSPLNPERLVELMTLHSTTGDDITIEMETETALIINGATIDKIGPGW
ncbi:hypothetical protein [Pseudochryseolinea flava]|uniref:Uncharacterized protein n=1 Tax=Pseudochryseolinea flava TaxID=2059302 RepID=A0A364XZR4_9BACT|nr:hypothetical protein [Pseudochryseolinea flava]RAV98962.1 hypothetical protein DQQ10_21950 [Pseudochryseolinea flava]